MLSSAKTFLYYSLLFLFLLFCKDSVGQTYEKVNLIKNLDTLEIIHKIKKGKEIIQSFPDSAALIFEYTLEQSKLQNFDKGISRSYSNLINLDIINDKQQNALEKISQLFEYGNTKKNKDCLAIGYFYLGLIFQKQSKYDDAFEAYLKATYYSSELSDASNIYNNLSTVLEQVSEVEKSLNFLNKAIEMARSKNDFILLGYYFINKGKALQALNKLAASERYYDSAIFYAHKYQKNENLVFALLFKSDLYNSTGNYSKALHTIHEAELVLTENKITNNQINYLALLLKGNAFFKLKQYKDAENALLKAQEFEEQIPLEDYIAILLKLSKLYFEVGNYKKAYLFNLKANELSDRIKKKEVLLEVNEMETRYQTIEKDQKILQQKLHISEAGEKIIKRNNVILTISSSIIFILLAGIWVFIHQKRKVQIEKEIEHLKGKIEGEEKERMRLAHDLHDGINSQLSAIQSFLLAEENKYPFLQHSKNFNAAQNLLLETALGVRDITHNLAPENLLIKGLADTIKDFCSNIFLDRKIESHIEVYGDFDIINSSLSLSLYRIIQEITQNILKHSAASKVTILLYCEEEKVILIAEDNGKGIPTEVLKQKGIKGIGLSSVHERVKTHLGTIEIISTPFEGTTIHLTFPIGAKQIMQT